MVSPCEQLALDVYKRQVPNDGTNESRALTLLQTAGLIKLDVKDGELATIKNISENPKKLDIKEISAEQARCV